jgi:hypothetical protein
VVPRIFSTVRYLQGQSKSGVAGLEQATNGLPLDWLLCQGKPRVVLDETLVDHSGNAPLEYLIASLWLSPASCFLSR